MSQQYENVPVVTGAAMPPASAGFFQPAEQTASVGLLSSDQARSVAEVQAALVIAASRPRNELRSRDRLLQACQRVGLASSAVYEYRRGGSSVSGPSIRLAETAARAWGNMTYGFRELSRNSGVSECEAFAWDLETNTKAVRQFSVRHRRDTKKGGYDLTEERDIYELMANQAQRRVRAAILEIIPGDIIEDAVDQCERTMSAHVGNIEEATRNLLSTFAELGVTREAIEKRLGHRIDAIQPAQVLSFRKIYVSIRDGMSDPKDWFDLDAEALPSDSESGTKTADTAQIPGGKRRRTTPEELEALRHDAVEAWLATGHTIDEAEARVDGYARLWTAAQCRKVKKMAESIQAHSMDEAIPDNDPDAQSAQPKPETSTDTADAATIPTQPGEFPTCPRNGLAIDDWTCSECDDRPGCPAWK